MHPTLSGFMLVSGILLILQQLNWWCFPILPNPNKDPKIDKINLRNQFNRNTHYMIVYGSMGLSLLSIYIMLHIVK